MSGQIIAICFGLAIVGSYLVGVWCGHIGFWCDSRLDKLKQKEAGLVAELRALNKTQDSYNHYMVLNKLGRRPGDVARELTEVRASIIRLGALPIVLEPALMDMVVTLNNQQHQ